MLAKNSANHGVVEICCLECHTELLEYLIKQNHKDMSVWKSILKFCSSSDEDEAESAGRCLSILSKPGKFTRLWSYQQGAYGNDQLEILLTSNYRNSLL